MLRQAAAQYMGGGAGGPAAAPAPGGDAAPQGGGLPALLNQAVRMTKPTPQDISAWKQAFLMLRGILQEAQSGPQAGMGAGPAPSPSMGLAMGAAHASVPTTGRPPI